MKNKVVEEMVVETRDHACMIYDAKQTTYKNTFNLPGHGSSSDDELSH
jgi:hypothetical protein